MSAVIVELDRREREAGIQVVVHTPAEGPGRAGAGDSINAGMGDSDQTVNKDMEFVRAHGELGAELNVVLVRADTRRIFVVAAEIGLEAEPIGDVSRKRSVPAAAMRKRVAIEQGIADKEIACGAFTGHAVAPLRPTAERKNKKHENNQGFAHHSASPPVGMVLRHLL